ncbi:MAG: hypothetical protein ACRD10_02875, partial [Terriglobia bacterium]
GWGERGATAVLAEFAGCLYALAPQKTGSSFGPGKAISLEAALGSEDGARITGVCCSITAAAFASCGPDAHLE